MILLPSPVARSNEVKSVGYSYNVMDDWQTPPNHLPELPVTLPKGQSTDESASLTGTPIPRAYDWLVTQYSMLTPVTPINPVITKRGPLTPNYMFNPPSFYTTIGPLY